MQLKKLQIYADISYLYNSQELDNINIPQSCKRTLLRERFDDKRTLQLQIINLDSLTFYSVEYRYIGTVYSSIRNVDCSAAISAYRAHLTREHSRTR